MDPHEADGVTSGVETIPAPKLAWAAMLVSAAAAVASLLAQWGWRGARTDNLAWQLFLLFYLATFVFAIRTLDHLRRLRKLAGPTRGERVRRRLSWVVIVVFAGTPVVVYAILLIALAHNGLPAY